MSNGTPNFSEWVKVPLPNPRYLNNSKLNDFESTDVDNDGYVDLIIATTRDPLLQRSWYTDFKK